MLTATIIAVFLVGIILSCIYIIYEHNSPSATLAWLLSMIFLPFIGLAAYLVLGRRRVDMRIKLLRAIRDGVGDIRGKLEFHESFNSVVKSGGCAKKYEDLMRLAYKFPGLPPTLGNSIKVLKDADASYPEIFRSIRDAKEHIHAMYYIIEPDEAGRRFRDALTEKAKEGVEVRLLYDDIGSIGTKLSFFKPLIDAGGIVKEYRPVHFARLRTLYANFRNHRKILVVDGRTAHTGGINIGDEYLGKDPELGYWRDTNIEITGPAASHLQLIFAEDWYYVTGELLTKAYVKPPPLGVEGGGVVQIVPSGPDRTRNQIAHLYFTAITSARKRLFITTPYFVPDESVQTAIIAACLRGVDVRLLVPRIYDKKIIKYASHSYYRELLEVGCRIFEYKKGFVHSKTMSVDGELAIVGTANMDIRSFRLNFEVCAVCYCGETARLMDEQFMADLEDSEAIRMKSFRKRPGADIFLENVARLTSSLL